MTEIKPCPFCKSTSNLPWEHEEWCFIRKHADSEEDYYKAGFGGGEFNRKTAHEHKFDRHSNEELIEAWNTRAERTCRYDTINPGHFDTECGRFAYWNHDGCGSPPEYCPHCGGKVVSE